MWAKTLKTECTNRDRQMRLIRVIEQNTSPTVPPIDLVGRVTRSPFPEDSWRWLGLTSISKEPQLSPVPEMCPRDDRHVSLEAGTVRTL